MKNEGKKVLLYITVIPVLAITILFPNKFYITDNPQKSVTQYSIDTGFNTDIPFEH